MAKTNLTGCLIYFSFSFQVLSQAWVITQLVDFTGFQANPFFTWLQSWVEILLQGGKCSLPAGKWLWWLSLVSSSCKRRNHPGSTITCPRFPGFFFQNNNNNSSQEHACTHTNTLTSAHSPGHASTQLCCAHTHPHHKRAHTHTHTHTHPHSHTLTHTHTHTSTYTRLLTHTHTSTRGAAPPGSCGQPPVRFGRLC